MKSLQTHLTFSETDNKVLSAIHKNPYIKPQELLLSLEIGKSYGANLTAVPAAL